MSQNNFRIVTMILVISVALTVVASAQTFKTVVEFDGVNGGNPFGSVIRGTDGSYYGTTQYGGNYQCGVIPGCGTVYKISSQGVLTTLYEFCSQPNCTDGISPWTGLLLGTDGNFYGTTYEGGNEASSVGTFFKITPEGKLTTLYKFCAKAYCTDGANPSGALIQAADGNFYGTTQHGGAGGGGGYCDSGAGCGTVFRMTPSGVLTTLYAFTNFGTDGATPESGVTQGPDGNFYGTTSQGQYNGVICQDSGGDNGCGTVFKITPAGEETTIYDFCKDDQYCMPDGAIPNGLTLAADGNFYGTTSLGGEGLAGTLYKITPQGQFTALYQFCALCSVGAYPASQPIQGTDGAFYGTTDQGGNTADCQSIGCGVAYRFTSDGTLIVIHTFQGSDGQNPDPALTQSTAGYFLGVAYQGAIGDKCFFVGCGTVFGISTGLGPFVTFVQNFGKVGQTGQILGQRFTGATSVKLNGVATSFTVVSDTFIRFTVPKGATSGYVTVSTPSSTLKSNVRFAVLHR